MASDTEPTLVRAPAPRRPDAGRKGGDARLLGIGHEVGLELLGDVALGMHDVGSRVAEAICSRSMQPWPRLSASTTVNGIRRITALVRSERTASGAHGGSSARSRRAARGRFPGRPSAGRSDPRGPGGAITRRRGPATRCGAAGRAQPHDDSREPRPAPDRDPGVADGARRAEPPGVVGLHRLIGTPSPRSSAACEATWTEEHGRNKPAHIVPTGRTHGVSD